MAYFSDLYLPGAITLWCAVFFSLASIWGYSLVLRGDSKARGFARQAYYCFALSIVLCAVILGILLMRRDFRIEYVYQYSGLDLPFHFQLAAFWAGQKGSFLIWLFWGTVIGLPLMHSAGRQEAPTMSIFTLAQLGLLFILVRENPFVMLTETPVDGAGLNPLLQDDWMVIHPPIMFIGYALAAVPFAFATAAMWRRDYDSWARRAFPWALAGFLVLGCAILMGGYWAYKTLGWGGYWGWDPVENASLIPWLIGVVLIHGLHMERMKKRYRRANLILASLVFISVLYGTFLTRSGVLADFSVHSFVDLGISKWLIGLMATFIGIAGWLLVTRLPEVETRPNEDPLLSRGAFMVASTIVVLVSAIVITVGTSAPLLTRFMENPGQVGPEFYNRVNAPIAFLIALLLAMVPFLTWKGVEPGTVLRRLRIPAMIALAIAVASLFAGVRGPYDLSIIFLACVALITNLDKTLDRARVGGLGKAGGYLAHVGVGVILLGILASSAYDESTKVTLVQQVPTEVDDLTLTFNRFIPRQGRLKERMEIQITRPGGSSFLVYPKLFINDRTRQVMANPDIRSSLLQDLYVSPIDYDPGRAPNAPQSFSLAKGEGRQVGDAEIRFEGFDLAAQGDPMTALASGNPVSIGARLTVLRGGEESELLPVYTLFQRESRAEAVAEGIPGGGFIRIGRINAVDAEVILDVVGIGDDAGEAPKLSIDVTRKPLINLVWYGLYIILFGGVLATWNRYRENRLLEALEAKKG